MGDMPDFENMTLEEQMRWLESLAARQGANPQEFMTTADMSVPEIDPNSVVIDEPGYVPSEKFSRPLSAAAGPSRPVEEPPQATEPIEVSPAPPVEAPAYDYSYAEQPTMMDYSFQEPPPIEPVASAALDANDPLGGMDPMAWLESLAARQGANPNEFTTAANYEIPEVDPNSVVIDEPGYVPSEKFSRPLSAAAGPSHPVQEPAAFETSATQPYEVPAEQPEFSFETPAAAWVPQDGEIPVDVDPMAWLESLAARQGADPNEFMTAANYEIPEIDPNSVVIDEPGYVPYSPFETTSGQSFASSESYPPSMPLPESAPELSEDTSSLSWLSDLAGDQSAGVTDFLSSMAADDIPGFDLSYEVTPEPTPTTPHMITSIEGLTDEQIAEAQAHGTITPEAELAWLMKKAEALAALTPLNDEFEATHPAESEEIAPGQIPDWLAAQMPSDLEAAPVTEDTFPALIDEILPPPAPTDLPDWLSESPIVQELPEIELPEFTLEDTTSFAPMQDEILAASDFIAGYAQSGDDWAAALDEEYTLQHESLTPPAEPDWYAEAVSKVEEIMPEMVQTEALPEFDISMFEVPIETEIIASEPTDLPDWLQEMSSQVVPADSDLPEWLISSQIVEPEAISEIATPDWLSEPVMDPLSFVAENAPPETSTAQPELAFLAQTPSEASAEVEEHLPVAQEGGLPSWYQAPVVETPPAPVYVAPAQPVYQQPPVVMTPTHVPSVPPMAPPPSPMPVVAPAASSRQVAQPVPPPSSPALVPAGFAQYQASLEQNPSDHHTRLNLARELEKVGNLGASLDHYETLVESSAALEVVADDLSRLATRQPQNPKVRRLLGDTYMRQGRLQEALDTYRGALNQL
ncbi:MAG: hypothetical protein K8L91_12235 [Anaerolineae bacterium]|nr:hypothetical protein [Anaerolineae bacterium]